MGLQAARVYRLDEDGNRILDSKGKPLFDAVPTTDWGSPETLEHGGRRGPRCATPNLRKRACPAGSTTAPDLRQSLDLLPPSTRGRRCGRWRRGDRHRQGQPQPLDQGCQRPLERLEAEDRRPAGLAGRGAGGAFQAAGPRPCRPAGNLLRREECGRVEQQGQDGHLEKFADTVNYLTEQKLYTVDDLEARVTSHNERIEERKASMDSKQARMKELQDLLEQAGRYRKLKPVHDQINAIHRQGQRRNSGRPRGGASAILYGPPPAERPLHAGGQAAPY